MSVVWALTALPMMVSAFLLGDVCVSTVNCTVTPGTISEEVSNFYLNLHILNKCSV